jgi:cardiolipin synthase
VIRANEGWRGSGRVVRLLAMTLCVLPLLAACGAGGNPENRQAAVTAAPTLTPLPTLSSAAPLPDRLHLRTHAPNALTLFIQPDDGRGPILTAFNNAQTRIDLTIYLLSDREVIAALKNAALRGVAVRVMLEPNPCCGNNNAPERTLFGELQDAHVQVQWTNPSFRLTHAKFAVVDGATGIVMAQNLTKTSFTFNREAGIIDRDAADVTALANLFAADWARAAYTPTDPNLVIANIDARQKLLALINGAGKSLIIESEEMQDAAIIDALIAAQKRGVSVRYIGAAPLTATSGPVQPDGNAPGRKRLVSGGVGVRVLASPYVHTKTIVVDTLVAFVGSENFSAASLDTNREVGLLTTDTAVITRLTTVYTKDWLAAKPDM